MEIVETTLRAWIASGNISTYDILQALQNVSCHGEAQEAAVGSTFLREEEPYLEKLHEALDSAREAAQGLPDHNYFENA